MTVDVPELLMADLRHRFATSDMPVEEFERLVEPLLTWDELSDGERDLLTAICACRARPAYEALELERSSE